MSKTSAIVFFSIILVGLVISIVTLNLLGDKKEITESALPPKPSLIVEEPVDPETAPPAPNQPKVNPKAKEAAPVAEKAPTQQTKKSFRSPEEAMKALAEKIEAKDFKGFEEIVGTEAIPNEIRSEVKGMVESTEYSLNEEKPFTEISKSAEALRWSLNFIPKSEGQVEELFADLSVGDDRAVDFKQLSFPIEPIDLSKSEATPSDPGEQAAPKQAGSQKPDAVTIALAFSKAVVSRDFPTARALADPATVTDERVAALMIAMEEGDFRLREDRPLVVTLSRDDITWVLTRVEAASVGSEFAIELGKVEDNWKVNGLTFSKVLSTLASQAGGGDIAYSPIVEDPEGGDSLVLYFEFDDEAVTPRANRQLAIVADILSQGADRVIRINGHADALGTDEYNANLSDGRAEAIRRALIQMGVSANQIITESFGESKPRSPNFNPDGTDNPTGRSKNRRAEVYLDF